MDLRFSCYGLKSTRPSPVSRMMSAFSQGFRDGVDINLGVGYVNEATIPVDDFRDAMDCVIRDTARYRQAFNYGGPEGSQNLILSLRRFLERRGTMDAATLQRKRLIVGACGATSILDSLAEVFEAGIVVTSDPLYYIYADALERKGFEILAVPEDDEGIDLEILERKLEQCEQRNIAFFYTVTVNNPSCTILSNARRLALLEVASRLSREQNRKIPIFFDLAYELLLHDPAASPFLSAMLQDELEIAYEIGTLSKVLAPALRIGYLLGPKGPLMDAMVQKTSDTGFSAPLFVQDMASYLLDRRITGQLARVNAAYREKAVAVRHSIDANLGGRLEECRGGSAGFYFYLTFRDVETHPESAFFRRLTTLPAPRVMYIPGTYCVHAGGDLSARGKRQLRLSYGFENAGPIDRALQLMREAAY